jgi:translocation and assembly module TamA
VTEIVKMKFAPITSYFSSMRFEKGLMLCVFLSASLISPDSITNANALDFFGKKLFDSKSENVLVADPLNYSVTLETTGVNSEETASLRKSSELIADQSLPVSGLLGLLTKAKSDRDNLVGAMYDLARYGAVVDVYVNGANINDIAPTSELSANGPVPVRIMISGGRVFKFGRTELLGDSDLRIENFGISKGEPASSSLILKAQDAIVSELKERGFPMAAILDSSFEADHDAGLLDISIRYARGPKAPIGATVIEGAETVDADFVSRQARIEEGSTYSPAELAAAKKRLLDLGVFSSVTVSEGDALDANGRVPILIEVKERKHRYFGLGASYSNADGAGVEAYWGHRNLFGRAEKLRVEGAINRLGENNDLSKLNFSTAILFEKPGAFGPNASFTANARAVSENYDAFERRSLRGGVGFNYKVDEKQTLSGALDMDWSRIVEGKTKSNHLIVSAPFEYTYDGSDDRLDPTKGTRFSALLEPAHDIETSATFVKGRLAGSVYYTPGTAEYVTFAGRAAVGSIIGADLADIPADRRFYAGGGGSIRGFAFQGVGPRDATGRFTGGRSLVEASIEARIQISETLGLVPFVDMGNVSTSSTPSLSDIRVGAGLGVRYKTPFGPLRLDVGVPIDRRSFEDRWAIYAGIGQAF